MIVQSNSPLQNPPKDYAPANSVNWFTIPEGYDAGKTLFYFDHLTKENIAPEATIVFVHGNPESSYTYRHIRDTLIASNRALRIVAMDHIGLGLSDQADYEMLDMHHSKHVKQLIQHLDLRNVTLVVHDWGGPIGIGAFMDEPERVSALLVMNTTVFPMPDDGLTYKNYPFPWLPWYLTPYLIPDSLWGGMAAKAVPNAHKQSTLAFAIGAAKWLTKHALNNIDTNSPEYVFSQMLRSKANGKSSKRNVHQTPYWGHGYSYTDKRHGTQDNRALYQQIQSTIHAVWKDIPACGYFGQWDACGKDSVIAQWHHALPQMKENTHIFPDIGHFIEEYKGEEMAASILKMLS